MKRKFGMLLVLSTALVLASCNNGPTPLEEAADYYYQTIKDDTTTVKSYELNSKLVVAGVTYTVTWELNVVSGNADHVKLGELTEKGTYPVTVVYDALKSTSEVKYTLTATIADENGNTEKLEFDRVIPEFKYASLKDFQQAVKDGSEDILNVSGHVTAVYKSGVYLQNEAGEGFYAYKPAGVSATQEALFAEYPIGTEIIVSGVPTSFSGQLEFNSGCTITKLNPAAADFELTYADKTEAYTNYDSKNDTVNDLVNSLVEIKGATLGAIDTSNYYYYFTVGANEYYLRTSGSFNDFNTTEGDPKCVNNIVAEWQTGYTATIRGLASIYGGKYYITPVEMDAVEITGKQLTDEVKVQLAVEETASYFEEAYVTNTQVTLPANPTSDSYKDVALTYSLTEGTPAANFAIADGKLNITIPEGAEPATGGITVTATLNGKTESATYDLVAKLPEPSSIAAFVDAKDSENLTYLQGVVTAVNKVGEKGSFVLSDASGSVFSYSGADVALGDEVLLKGKYGENNGTPQLSDITVIKTVSTGNDVIAASGTPVAYTAQQVYDVVSAETATDASIAATYEGQFLAITGYLFASGDYINMAKDAATAEAGTKCINVYKNSSIDASALVGQEATIYGFYRGHSTGSDYLTIQVQAIVAKGATYEPEAVECVELGTYSFATTATQKGVGLDADTAKAIFDASYTGTQITLDSVAVTTVYEGNGDGGVFPQTSGLIKMGKSKTSGEIVLTFASNVEISKVVINTHDWYTSSEQYPTTSRTLTVNGQTQTNVYTADGVPADLTFEFDASNVVTIASSERCFVFSITVYGTVTE